jgi:hypothetical protein
VCAQRRIRIALVGEARQGDVEDKGDWQKADLLPAVMQKNCRNCSV